jgi:hypothetical protein
MSLEVKHEFPWTPVRSFTDGNPWTIAFVYPRKSAGFVVKGGMNKVKEWIKGSGIKRALVHYTMFGHVPNVRGEVEKDHRSVIHVFTGSDMVKAFVSRIGTDRATGKKPPKNRRWQLLVFTTDGKPRRPFSGDGPSKMVLDKRLRRPPRCWPKELDQFLLSAGEVSTKSAKPQAPAKPKPFVSPCPKCEHAIIELNVGVTGCKLSRYAEKGQNCPLESYATIVAQKPPTPWTVNVVAESREAAIEAVTLELFDPDADQELNTEDDDSEAENAEGTEFAEDCFNGLFE